MKCQACDKRQATHKIEEMWLCLFCAVTYLASKEGLTIKEKLNERED